MKRLLFILFVVLSGFMSQSHWPVRGLQQIKKAGSDSEFFINDDKNQTGSFFEIEDNTFPFPDGKINFNSNLKPVNARLLSFLKDGRICIFQKLLLFHRIDLPPPLL